MTARKKVSEVEPIDLAPIELDPPNPAITRWHALADRDFMVYHDGDAEVVLGNVHPRPVWADPDMDHVGRSHLSTWYSSRSVRVASAHDFGVDHGDHWQPSCAWVAARFYGNSHESICVTLSQVVGKGSDSKWQNVSMSFQPNEARELAAVILAAVDLIGTTE